MSNEEIFARIGADVSDVYKVGFGPRDITIWMTKDLFNKLCPEQIVLHKDNAMTTLFGCIIKVVVLPCSGMQWIVGYDGTAEESEDD